MPNIYSHQTKNFPLFLGNSYKRNIQAKEKGFVFFIPLFQTISVINRNDTCYYLHASK